jgi:N-acetylmuramoyl-L-alanine amidase
MEDVKVTIDGREISFPDPNQRPVLNNGRIRLPLRAMFNALGVSDDNITFTQRQGNVMAFATVKYHRYSLMITENSTTFKKTDNIMGLTVTIDFDRGSNGRPVPAVIESGRFMIPLRSLLESVGCKIEWIGATRTVSIEKMAKVIFLDPGHGGSSPGAVGMMSKYGEPAETVYEKDLNLSFAMELKHQLESCLNVICHMSRTTDIDVGINDRWQMARNLNADAFISIHFNGSVDSSREGTEAYYADTRRQDIPFAAKLSESVAEALSTIDRGAISDIRSQHGSLGVLRNPTNMDYPRTILEVQYISNREAMDHIGFEYYEKLLDFCKGVSRVVKDYFNLPWKTD